MINESKANNIIVQGEAEVKWREGLSVASNLRHKIFLQRHQISFQAAVVSKRPLNFNHKTIARIEAINSYYKLLDVYTIMNNYWRINCL